MRRPCRPPWSGGTHTAPGPSNSRIGEQRFALTTTKLDPRGADDGGRGSRAAPAPSFRHRAAGARVGGWRDGCSRGWPRPVVRRRRGLEQQQPGAVAGAGVLQGGRGAGELDLALDVHVAAHLRPGHWVCDGQRDHDQPGDDEVAGRRHRGRVGTGSGWACVVGKGDGFGHGAHQWLFLFPWC